MSTSDQSGPDRDQDRDPDSDRISRRYVLGASFGIGGAAVAGMLGAQTGIAARVHKPTGSSSRQHGPTHRSRQRAASAAPCTRTLTEVELPEADVTHEIIKMPSRPLVLISQMSNSTLVKIRLDAESEEITGVRGFPLGPPSAMLHGLTVSTRNPGKIWATHEGGNQLLLVDPGTDLDSAPRILRRIDIPGDGSGPHHVSEYGSMLWVTLKVSDQILTISQTDTRRFRLYEAEPHPVFVVRHPTSGEMYATQDKASKLLRIRVETGRTEQIEIPAERGTTPVGMVAGPLGIWFVLLGTETKGTGTFGRIDEDGTVTWFKLTSPVGRDAALLHIAFEPSSRGPAPSAWLLSSSIISPNAFDAMIRVTFDRRYTQISSEEVAAVPSQRCKAHRVLPLERSVLATELTNATVAQLRDTQPGCRWEMPAMADEASP